MADILRIFTDEAGAVAGELHRRFWKKFHKTA